ncbi:flagellar filament capping protein FliD [Bacillus sp. FJAT-29937]|uniref:flagellar filament capping protein FliD n=1 Tax=Bacillus sp. FJAT-29937 TaxID=1720553 RepID=UPI000830C53B|nr:flagellar filament capping protein FliD [Bacillus sp. FJAT-29937]
MAGLRITGLATGMDIDSIVKDMVRAQRIPFDKMGQKKQTLEWKRDNYREMNTLLFSLREETLKMRLTSTYLTKTATSSNDSKISASSDPTAGNASYTFNKVDRLASAATNASEIAISKAGGKIDPKASVYSLQDKFAGSMDASEWKTTDGNGYKETVKVTKASKTISLSQLSGGIIDSSSVSGTEIQIINGDKTNGDKFKVITDKSKLDDLKEDEVFVNTETGQLTFGKELAAGSSFDLSYKYNKKDTLTASTAKKEFNLSNAGIANVQSFTVTTYEKNADGTIKKNSSGNSIVKQVYTYTKDADGKYKSSPADNEVTIDENTGKLTFDKDLEQGAKIEAEYSYKFFEMKMSSHTSKGQVTESFKINAGDSFNSVLDKISKSGLGVNAFYDEYADKVTVTRTETGDYNANVYGADGTTITTRNAEISFMNDPFLKNILQLHGRNEKGGDDAKFTLNGLETGRHSNTFTVNGVNFTLKDVSNSPITIGTKTDTDKVFENIKSFIDKYNETIDKVNKKIGEEYYREFTPLTKEQRDSMSEDEIKMWEEKAKSGLLRRDQKLSNGLDKLRSDFYASVNFQGDSQYKQLSAIGITTTNLYNVNKGKLEINEAKLKEAINNDPEGIYKLFAADSENYSEKGIARRLRDSLTTTMQSIEETAGNDLKTNSQFTIGKNLDDLNTRMKDFEGRLKQLEDRYYKQFNAMEQAIQKMNQQSSYMMQQLGMAMQQ